MENKIVNTVVPVGSGGFLMWAAGLPWPTISYVIGILVAVLGLGISWYFQWKKDKRDRAESIVIIEAYKRGIGYGKERSGEQQLD